MEFFLSNDLNDVLNMGWNLHRDVLLTGKFLPGFKEEIAFACFSLKIRFLIDWTQKVADAPQNLNHRIFHSHSNKFSSQTFCLLASNYSFQLIEQFYNENSWVCYLSWLGLLEIIEQQFICVGKFFAFSCGNV